MAFPLQQWLQVSNSILCYTYIVCHVYQVQRKRAHTGHETNVFMDH